MISIARPLLGTDEETFNINPDAIIEKITPILEITEDHNLTVIEDACQAELDFIINIIKEVELS